MLRKRRERGEGQGGCIVGLLILLLVVFIAFKLIPVKVRAAEFRQTVEDTSRQAGSLTTPRIEASILRKAEALELPVDKKNLIIKKESESIRIEVSYVVPVQFPGYTFNWKFHHTTENPIF